jgi:hypothetical protein
MTIDDQQRMNDRLVELVQRIWLPKDQQLAILYGMIGVIAAVADDDLWTLILDAASMTARKGHRLPFDTPSAHA